MPCAGTVVHARNFEGLVIRVAIGMAALVVTPVHADELRIAVSSNFAQPLTEIARHFEKRTGHQVILSSGSTGKHYTQIHNGARFDVFFSADVEHAERLERDKLAMPGSRFTYAIGKVVLWSPRPGVVDSKGNVLGSKSYRHLAMANPALAPYGKAAAEVLRAQKLWDKVSGRVVRAENIGQAYSFVESGGAELGFVAYSQIRHTDGSVAGSFWLPPTSMYTPIEQQAVLLSDATAGREFMAYMKSAAARRIILTYGYETP